MQPYFFPYIGYFQLMRAVEKFVIYDNIQFTKKGWINRNKILLNGRASYITLPLKKDSDYLDIYDRYLAENFQIERKKILRKIESAYRKAPFYENVLPIIKKSLAYENNNLFCFINNSISLVKKYLSIETSIVKSSSINIDHSLKGQDRVLAICKELQASEYINLPGGTSLYSKKRFSDSDIKLKFIYPLSISYQQNALEFIPSLSILDVLMWNPVNKVVEFLDFYDID
jgi:hypothetical protein